MAHPNVRSMLAGTCALALGVGSSIAAAQEPEPPPEQPPSPPPAPAAPSEEARVAEGREAFLLGTSLARQGQWLEALATFERSSNLRPHPVTTYNVAVCERALRRSTRARKLFARAIADHEANRGGRLPENLERAARTYLDEVDGALARVQVALAPPGATISVDGRPLEVQSAADAPPVVVAGTRDPGRPEKPPAPRFVLVVDPGPHVFVVVHPSGNVTAMNHTFERGARRELSIDVPAEPPSARSPRPVAPPRSKTPGYAALGVGGLGLLTGGVTGVLFLVNRSELEDVCIAGRCPSDRDGQIGATNALGTTAVIGLAIGAAGVGVGTFLLVRAGSASQPQSSIRPWIGVGSAGLASSF